VHSGYGGSQRETSREGLDVDFLMLVHEQNPKLDEGFELATAKGTVSDNNRIGLEGKGVCISYMVNKEENDCLVLGTFEGL
jgi:hypothetical protein